MFALDTAHLVIWAIARPAEIGFLDLIRAMTGL
jgi:hypothetical protein